MRPKARRMPRSFSYNDCPVFLDFFSLFASKVSSMAMDSQTGTCQPDVANCRALQSAVANLNVGVIAMKLHSLGVAAAIGIQLLCGGCDSSSKTELRFQVASSSMAPQWFGSHRTAECEVCGRRWKIHLRRLMTRFRRPVRVVGMWLM